jgi:hypothetical protein
MLTTYRSAAASNYAFQSEQLVNSTSMRARVFWPGVIGLICLWLTSCGGGSSHSPSSVSTAVHVSPSAAIVATSTTQQFTATVTGVSNTAVNWSVNGVAGGNGTVGTVSGTGLYTAPSLIPSPATVTVTAADQASPSLTGNASVTVINPPNNQQTQPFPIKLGTTGGNVNDFTIKGNIITCCSGTLGSLVSRGGAQFILSNNHVLARSDQAKTGEIISQPGLVDNNCNPGNTVAHLTQAAPLKTSGVDAAGQFWIWVQMARHPPLEHLKRPQLAPPWPKADAPVGLRARRCSQLTLPLKFNIKPGATAE